MSTKQTIIDSVENLLSTSFNERTGTVIPDQSTVALADGAVKITVTFLYADLAGSSVLAEKCPWQTTARILRSYLDISTRLIRKYNGEVMSFDGDRVMGVFKSETPNTDAVKCARNIDWAVTNVLNPKAKQKFASIKNNDITIKHCVGVDYGEVRAVRAGIRNNNDLIWIGKAPSLAAKLSDVREYPYEVYISKAVYEKIGGSTQLDEKKVSIWEQRNFTFVGNVEKVYRTISALSI